MQHTPKPDPLLLTEQAAEFLQIKPGTLENWRSTKRVEIPFIRLGRSIRYRLSDLEKFLERGGATS